MRYLVNTKKTAGMSLKACVSVLVMAEIELIFFIVAVMVLLFGFVVDNIPHIAVQLLWQRME